MRVYVVVMANGKIHSVYDSKEKAIEKLRKLVDMYEPAKVKVFEVR